MNAANVIKAAELTKALTKVRHGMLRNIAGCDTHIQLPGMTPLAVNSKAAAAMLTALEAHLIAELTALGVTQLEAA